MTREEAIKILTQLDRVGCNMIHANDAESIKYNQESIEALNMAIEALKHPEIITCKKCAHWVSDYTIPPTGKIEMHFCPMVDCSTEENYYCHYAERKEN